MPKGYRASGLSSALKPPNNMLKTTPLNCRACTFRSHCHTNAHTCNTVKPSTLALRAAAKLRDNGHLAIDGKLLVPDEAVPALPCPPDAA